MLNLDALGDEGDEDGAEDNSAENTDSSDEGSQDEKSGDKADAKVVSLADFLESRRHPILACVHLTRRRGRELFSTSPGRVHPVK